MTIRENEAREVMRKSSLEAGHIEAAIGALRRAHLVERAGGVESLKAAASAPIKSLSAAAADKEVGHLAKQAIAMLIHAGIQFSDEVYNKPLDPHVLSAALKERGLSVEARFRIKDALHSCGCL
jgi:hypothetical protein